MVTRESHLVELVDAGGTALGSLMVAEAHTAPGRLHRAYSVMLLDDQGRVLLQQRAAVKTRFALRWANACCGHPAPGQGVLAAAAERLVEEIGLREVALKEAGVYLYRAEDPRTGRVEHEYDHVVVGLVPADVPLDPDPAEVADVRWVPPEELRADLAAHPDHYAPWLGGVLAVATNAADRLPHAAGLSTP
ncbi:isopentenyl-diphosphate Delta-isomerase [Streptomyces sp. WMMC500]|uniref:isopentenyl-diphosphate Delta-isomerase n=1 Tax=Streptomyces sp. WMMC500 TaxID=3015154 RepID=UPI00248BCD8A|nr:isopentenyl-diphosphate Delta-isomerase [Streptomyces sp. WMMC500]WBB61003.1 isopentenyl-diphosphate Delta-isomerase [Streptomyces sp. WMMC500]